MTRKIVCFLFLLLTLAIEPAQASLFSVKESVLQNGATVVTVEDHSSPVVTFQFFVDASIRKEMEGITGVSHFTEHYFHSGSKNLPGQKFFEALAKAGSKWNAGTGFDYTTYYSSVPREKFEEIARMYSDILLNKTFPEEYFKNEMKVVQEERRLSDNDPKQSAFLAFQDLVFKGSNYRFPILGYMKDLESMRLADVRGYFDEHYSVGNLIFVVSGDVVHSEVMGVLGKYFGNAKGKKTWKVIPSGRKVKPGERRLVKEREGIEIPYILIGYPTFEFDDPDYFALSALVSILSDGDSSRFQMSLVKKKKLAQSINAEVFHTKEKGAVIVEVEPLKGVYPSILERAVYEEIERMKAGPLPDELAKVIANTEKSFLTGLQTTASKARLVGSSYILSKRKYLYYEDFLDNLRKVTVEDIKRVAKKYFDPWDRSVFIQMPKGSSYYGTTEKDVDIERLKHSSILRFKNGLLASYQESKEIPAVHARFMIRGGSSIDPKGKEGLAGLLASLLTKGTVSRNEEILAKTLDENAIDLNAWADEEFISVDMEFLREKTDLAFDIAAEILTDLSIDKDVFERERKRIISTLQEGMADPDTVGERALRTVLFEGGFGHMQRGYTRTLKNITAKDLMDFYKDRFNAQDTTIALSGDIDMAYVIDLLGDKLKGYSTKSSKLREVKDTVKAGGLKYYIVDMPWLSQAYIFAGGKGIAPIDPGYNKARLLNYILGGGGFTSRLMSKLRGQMGLAYRVYSYLESYKYMGTFNFGIQTKTASALLAVNGFLNELKEFSASGPSLSEFSDAKSYFRGVLPLKIETIGQRSDEMARGMFYKDDPESVYNDVREIEGLKIEDLNSEKGRFSPKDLNIVILGKAEEIGKQLKGEIVELKLKDLF